MNFSQRLAVAFWASFVAIIVFETVFSQPWMNSSEYFFLTALFLTLLALGWVLADSKENDLRVPMLLSICIVAVPFLGVPYYRFRYFGVKAGLIFLGIVALNFAGLLLIDYALQYLTIGGRTA